MSERSAEQVHLGENCSSGCAWVAQGGEYAGLDECSVCEDTRPTSHPLMHTHDDEGTR